MDLTTSVTYNSKMPDKSCLRIYLSQKYLFIIYSLLCKGNWVEQELDEFFALTELNFKRKPKTSQRNEY